MKKVLLIRTNKVDPDPRVEKEVTTLSNMGWLDTTILAWDRGAKHPVTKENLKLPNDKTVPIYRFGIPAEWGKGMQSNVKSAIIYEMKLFFWLLHHIHEYDCIHACDLLTGFPSIILAKLFRKKVIYDCCDYYADTQHGPEWILQTFRNMETFVIRNAEATILCSEKRREQIEPAHPKELCYIHNSPHINALRFDGEGERVCKSDSSRLKLVYVGNFCADRWILELLENVSKMPTKVEMHIGGIGGLSDQVNAYAEKYENIFAYGKMKYQDVLKLESECDCLAALYETHIRNHVYAAPNKFYEALALGKPLLMIEGSGMSEIVEREHLGVLMKPTAESFESALSEIQELIQTDKTLKERMKKLFEERYSRTIMEKRLTNLYEQIVGK